MYSTENEKQERMINQVNLIIGNVQGLG